MTYEAPFERNKEQGTRNKIDVLVEHGIKKPYVLYVGSAYPHKNVRGLLAAWELFEKQYGQDYQLVLVGKENYFYKRLKANHYIHSTMNGVVFAGGVSDDDLEMFYREASLFIFPSLYEGFGLPPLEAMSRGIPVVSSNRSCMPEILGEAVLFVDPENVEQMAETLYRGLTDQLLRGELRERGREEVKRYSWDRLARQTLACYENVLEKKEPVIIHANYT